MSILLETAKRLPALRPFLRVLAAGSPSERVVAVTAVAATGDVWVVPLLRELASDDALEVARASLVALESLSPGAAREVAELLAQDGRRAYSALGREALQRLQAAPGQSFLASSLAETLAQIAQLTDVAVLLRALDEPDVAIRIATARRVSEVGDERAISSLLHHSKERRGKSRMRFSKRWERSRHEKPLRWP